MAKKTKTKLPVASSNAIYGPSPREERKYRAEDALRTIEQAEGYRKDKDLMKDVKQLAREKVKNLKKVC